MKQLLWAATTCVWLALPRLVAGQLPAGDPPPLAPEADLPTLAAWIERWLPVVGIASSTSIDSTADFYSRRSDSIAAARLEGCTLVLHERQVRTARGDTVESWLLLRIPLDQVDTAELRPRIRRPQVLLSPPNVLLSGEFVVPLRSRTRARFISISPNQGASHDTLVAEHLVPLAFADIAATRTASVLRSAAAQCTGPPGRT